MVCKVTCCWLSVGLCLCLCQECGRVSRGQSRKRFSSISWTAVQQPSKLRTANNLRTQMLNLCPLLHPRKLTGPFRSPYAPHSHLPHAHPYLAPIPTLPHPSRHLGCITESPASLTDTSTALFWVSLRGWAGVELFVALISVVIKLQKKKMYENNVFFFLFINAVTCLASNYPPATDILCFVKNFSHLYWRKSKNKKQNKKNLLTICLLSEVH